jgi:hypothetical protein
VVGGMEAAEGRGAALRDKGSRQGQASGQEEKHAAGGNEETTATQERRRRHAWVGLCIVCCGSGVGAGCVWEGELQQVDE